jgi:1,2-diacylglycerol 3-beta-glucosyltransferase
MTVGGGRVQREALSAAPFAFEDTPGGSTGPAGRPALYALDPAVAHDRGRPWALLVFAGTFLLSIYFLGIDGLLSVATFALELLFFVFFIRHLAFAVAALRSAGDDLRAPAIDAAYLPTVSVLVPCRDEELVVEGLVAKLLALRYPKHHLQVVVIDDGSIDDTGRFLDDVAAGEPRLLVVHRSRDAGGGKSGALNAALRVATGEIVVVFDADHHPSPDVIHRLVRHFQDPQVGAVQGRCEIRNRDDSLLTKLVAIDYMAGYLVNEYGRQSVFGLPAYGGANCAIRASSLRAVGGWNEHTVTEDTDVTLRLILRGERVRYDVTAVDSEEGVVSLRRFWRQRYRWARGHQQVYRDYRSAVWGSFRLSVAEKVETTLFLLAFHVPVISGLGLLLVLLWGTGLAHPAQPFNPVLFWTLLFLGPLLELGGGLLIAQADRREVRLIPYFLPVFFVSIAVCTKAWFDAMVGKRYRWVTTARAGRQPLRSVES